LFHGIKREKKRIKKIAIKMSLKLKPIANNPYPIEFKK